MKKHYALYSLLLIPALVLLVAFSGGAPEARTGSPLDGNNCTVCHTGTAMQADNWISTNIPEIGYEPGISYTITITTVDQAAMRYGFQLTSETAVAKTGEWVITDADRTQLAGTAFVNQTLIGSDPMGTPNTWTVDWIAPTSGTGNVNFYAAVNVSNNDGSTAGDIIYLTSLMISESNVGIAETQLQTKVEVYPNPATTQLNMTLPVNSEIRIFDNNGREVMQRTSSNGTEVFDVSTLVNGMYFVHVSHNGQTASRSIIVR